MTIMTMTTMGRLLFVNDDDDDDDDDDDRRNWGRRIILIGMLLHYYALSGRLLPKLSPGSGRGRWAAVMLLL